jgi:hypothetical protein
VIFDPDLAKGNDGPQGFAEIHDGHFDTKQSGKGGPAGAVLLRFEGFDGAPMPGFPYGKPIFAAYTLKLDIPREDTTTDVAVPASAASGLPRRLGAGP